MINDSLIQDASSLFFSIELIMRQNWCKITYAKELTLCSEIIDVFAKNNRLSHWFPLITTKIVPNLMVIKVLVKLNRPYNAIRVSANKLGSKVSSASDINLQRQSVILLRTCYLTRCISSYIRIQNFLISQSLSLKLEIGISCWILSSDTYRMSENRFQ